MCNNFEQLLSLRLSNLCIDRASMQLFSDSSISLSIFALLKRKSLFVFSKRK